MHHRLRHRAPTAPTAPTARARRPIRGLPAPALAAVAAAAAAAACSDPPPPAFDVTIDCAATTEFLFPDTAPGETAAVILLATRTDDGESGAPRPALDGPDAEMFRIVSDATTCGSRALVPGETCATLVEYVPKAEGAHAATLRLGKAEVALGGVAAAAPPGLVASIRNAASLHGFFSLSSSHTLRLINESGSNIDLGPGTFTGTGAAFGATADCPATLTPGTACELQLSATPQTASCAAGSYRLPTSLRTIEIPMAVSFIGGVSLALSGMGSGRVVSSPPGLDCHRDAASGEQTGRCEQAFRAPVTLTAIPDAGHHFNGWSRGNCTSEEECTLEPVIATSSGPSSIVQDAAFASPSAKRLDVTFAGSGEGMIRGTFNCTASCSGWIEPESRAQLVAGSPSRFVGWSGACSGTSRSCDLGIVVNDLATTVTFDADDREQATLLPRLFSLIAAGGLLPDGELVVATGGGGGGAPTISRLSPAGDVRWSTKLTAGYPVSLKVAPSGESYVFTSNAGEGTLLKLDAAGAIAWERATAAPSSSAGRSSLVIVPSGGAAILVATGGGQVRTYAADGSVAWAAPVSAASATVAAVAVSATGVTAVALAGDSASSVRRFGASGAPLTPDWVLPAANLNREMSLAYDALGFLDAQTLWDPTPGTGGTSMYTLTRLDPTGTAVFSKQIPAPPSGASSSSARTGGMAVAANATVFSWISHVYTGRFGFGYPAGAFLGTYDPQGANTWVLDKPASPNGDVRQLQEGVTVEDVACAAGRCALFGSYTMRDILLPWIEVFTVP
jgi:PQQ-like domain/Divergent InlB B-repeat domain